MRDSDGGRFAAFTFDDGYRDNLTVALPVFRAHRVPVCVYVTTGLIDRTAPCWWGALAHLVESRDQVDLAGLGLSETLPTASWPEKRAAFARIEAWVHDDLESRAESVRQWCRDAGVDERAVLDAAMLTWDELREMARDPLVTIGAHGVTHRRLSRLDDESARRELADGRARIEAELGRPVRHLAYPYGGPAACGAREFRLAAEAATSPPSPPGTATCSTRTPAGVTALPRRRLTEGPPDLRTARRALTGTQWLLRRGPRVVTPVIAAQAASRRSARRARGLAAAPAAKRPQPGVRVVEEPAALDARAGSSTCLATMRAEGPKNVTRQASPSSLMASTAPAMSLM